MRKRRWVFIMMAAILHLLTACSSDSPVMDGEVVTETSDADTSQESEPENSKETVTASADAPALLWIHGGGYFLGMKEMVYMGRAADLVNRFGITVVSPGYRLAFQKPYPAALQDCYHTLIVMKKHATALGIDEDKIMVGGESAGGGLAAALCMLARDRGTVKIAYQFPLYPMLSNLDTESSRNNHGRVWDTRRNHLGWRFYLRGNAKKKVSPYASPIHQKDFSDLPPAYTFVGNGEPFYAETLEYIRKLKEAGTEAEIDVYPSDMHAFDMLDPESEVSRQAIRTFEERFEKALMGVVS